MNHAPPCPLCGSLAGHLFLQGHGDHQVASAFLVTTNDFGNFNDLWECPICTLVYQDSSPLELRTAYAQTRDPVYLEQEAGRQKTATNLLKSLERIIPGRNLLDVGCFTGTFLAAAQARGWQVTGVELSSWAIEIARTRYALDIHAGTIADVSLPAASFDLITVFDVIEHLTDPLATLRELYPLLKPGGYLYLSTPNVHSITARLLGRRWWSYRLEHIRLFGPASLGRVCKDAGFALVSSTVRGRDFTVHYWLSKLLSPQGRVGKPIFEWLTKMDLANRLVYLDLLDQLDVLAQKRPEGEHV